MKWDEGEERAVSISRVLWDGKDVMRRSDQLLSFPRVSLETFYYLKGNLLCVVINPHNV